MIGYLSHIWAETATSVNSSKNKRRCDRHANIGTNISVGWNAAGLASCWSSYVSTSAVLRSNYKQWTHRRNRRPTVRNRSYVYIHLWPLCQ